MKVFFILQLGNGYGDPQDTTVEAVELGEKALTPVSPESQGCGTVLVIGMVTAETKTEALSGFSGK